MAAGNLGTGIAERVESIFDDIVPGRADDVDEELTAEFGKPEASPDFAAVENDHISPPIRSLAPLCKDLAITGEQRHPTGDRLRRRIPTSNSRSPAGYASHRRRGKTQNWWRS